MGRGLAFLKSCIAPPPLSQPHYRNPIALHAVMGNNRDTSKKQHQQGEEKMSTYTTKWDEAFTITTRTGTYYEETGIYTIVEAHDEDGQLTSELYADPTTGQIMQVETAEAHRGEGIASALLAFAEENGIKLFHSPEEHCTPGGLAFAEKNDHLNTIDDDLAYAA